MAEQKQNDQLEHTYSSSVRIRDVALRTCQRRWMKGKSGERGSGISVMAARHDIYIYIYIYISVATLVHQWHFVSDFLMIYYMCNCNIIKDCVLFLVMNGELVKKFKFDFLSASSLWKCQPGGPWVYWTSVLSTKVMKSIVGRILKINFLSVRFRWRNPESFNDSCSYSIS